MIEHMTVYSAPAFVDLHEQKWDYSHVVFSDDSHYYILEGATAQDFGCLDKVLTCGTRSRCTIDNEKIVLVIAGIACVGKIVDCGFDINCDALWPHEYRNYRNKRGRPPKS